MKRKFKTIEDIRQQGFVGFVKIQELFNDQSKIPEKPGIYMVLYLGSNRPSFIIPGTGGFFKGKNPNVSTEALLSNWVKDTVTLYIGKAGGTGSDATLKKRLRQYLRFGQGADIGHYGGRLIWQIKDSGNLLVCWKTQMSEEPRVMEYELIQEFVLQYGKRPFANLSD